jgi:abortive infection bacteriophage resistance protein
LSYHWLERPVRQREQGIYIPSTSNSLSVVTCTHFSRLCVLLDVIEKSCENQTEIIGVVRSRMAVETRPSLNVHVYGLNEKYTFWYHKNAWPLRVS